MQTDKDRLMEITYEIYSKEHIISFENFFDKIVNDEDFDDEFNKLWEEAKKVDMERRRK
jgi:hypothetical protein